MAIVTYENLPSENTPLTGGASGNLNLMQENGTTHGSDTKLGYSQAFLNDHLVNISNEVDEDYRVNVLHSRNLFDKKNAELLPLGLSSSGFSNTSQAITIYIPCTPGATYTISKRLSARFRVCSSETIPEVGAVIHNYQNVDSNTSYTLTINQNSHYLCAFIYISTQDTLTPQEILDSIMINEGSEALSYEPYIQNKVIVDNEKYTDTLNVGIEIDNKSRVNVLHSKNLFDEVWENGGVNSTTGLNENNGDTKRIRTKGYIPVKPNTNYVITFDASETSSSGARIIELTNNKSFIQTLWYNESSAGVWKFTTPANCSYIRFTASRTTTDWDLSNIHFMMNEGNEALPYEPYITPSINVDRETIYQEALVQGTCTLGNEYDYENINYPNGFDKDNCIVTGVMTKLNNLTIWSTGMNTNVELLNGVIGIISRDFSTGATIDYKIILKKIS